MESKVAVVTGASSGIGEAISIRFASLGTKITLCGRDGTRLKSVLDKVVDISHGDRSRFLTIQGDINDGAVRRQIIEQTIQKFGQLDILVLNAAVTSPRQSVFKATEEIYDAILGTNLKSAFFLTQQAVPYLEKSKGNIITISSVITYGVDLNTTIYSISKVALDELVKHFAVVLGPKGIRVNSVNPGFIPTRIMRYLRDEMDSSNTFYEAAWFNGQPLKKRPMNFDDVVEAVLFLVSDAAGLITGERLYIDGGRRFCGFEKIPVLKPQL